MAQAPALRPCSPLRAIRSAENAVPLSAFLARRVRSPRPLRRAGWTPESSSHRRDLSPGMEPDSIPSEGASPSPKTSRIQAATLFCENCGESTAHRILRVDRASSTGAGRLRGVARCQGCRFTHPFESQPEARVDVALVVSRGPVSERRWVSLPRHRRLQVGSGVPESEEPLLIHRIDGPAGHPLSSAPAGEVSTLWASLDEGAVVLVSIAEGRRTRPARLTMPHGTLLRVGDELRVQDEAVRIVGLRARGATWRRLGDEFPADEVTRVYGRLTSMPPAGRSPWRRVRVSPSSRARAASTASRSRSAPGTSTTRTVPRARIAGGGAAVHSVSPS